MTSHYLELPTRGIHTARFEVHEARAKVARMKELKSARDAIAQNSEQKDS